MSNSSDTFDADIDNLTGLDIDDDPQGAGDDQEPVKQSSVKAPTVDLEAALKEQAEELKILKLQNVALMQHLDKPIKEDKAPVLEPPQRPTKPKDSTDDMAMQKYRDDMEEYRDSYAEFQFKKNELLQNQLAGLTNELREKERVQAQQVRLKAELQQKGFSPIEADGFLKKFGDPNAVTLDTLMDYYKTTLSPTRKTVTNKRKLDDVMFFPPGANMPSLADEDIEDQDDSKDPNKMFDSAFMKGYKPKKG
jgi:hypothetical protein